MAKYKELSDYFKKIATESTFIQHSPTAKRFLRMNIEEWIVGSSVAVATGNPFIVFINYIADYGSTHQTTKNMQLMFYVMKAIPPNDMDADEGARDLTERVLEEILTRIRFDSQNNNEGNLLESAFDKINDVRIVPADKRTGAAVYVGWQCTIKLPEFFAKCYTPGNWITP